MILPLTRRKCLWKESRLQSESDVSQVDNWFDRKNNSLREDGLSFKHPAKSLNEQLLAAGFSQTRLSGNQPHKQTG